jgi:hypothetical protein
MLISWLRMDKFREQTSRKTSNAFLLQPADDLMIISRPPLGRGALISNRGWVLKAKHMPGQRPEIKMSVFSRLTDILQQSAAIYGFYQQSAIGTNAS